MEGYKIMDKKVDEVWNLLIEYGVATQEELELITCINGYTIDTLNDVIYARTGYQNIEQIQDEIAEV